MKNASSIAAVFAAFLLFCGATFAAFDYSSIFNPENFKATDSVWRAADGKIAAEISFDSVEIEKTAKTFGVSVPKGLIVCNLRLVARLRNVGEKELEYISSLPWVPISARKVSIELEGKKSSLKFEADKAVLLSDKSVELIGAAKMESGGKIRRLGNSVRLSLRGRMIFVKSAGLEFAIRF